MLIGNTCALLYGIIVTVSILSRDPICNGTYNEQVFPKLFYRGEPADLHFIKDYNLLTLVFTWRHEQLRIILERHDIALDNSVLEIHEDQDRIETEELNDNRVHFQGYVDGARFSFAAVSINSLDMTGYIQFDGEGIYIESFHRDSARNSTGLNEHSVISCDRKPLTVKHHRGPRKSNFQKRVRRAPNDYTKFLEVLLVADTTVVQTVGQSRVKTYLLTLMNIVNEIYHDPTLDVNIEVVTVKIIYMDKSTEGHVIVTNDPQRTVDQFCYWASTQSYRSRRYARETAGSNHDAAVLLTRHKFTAAGFAPITGMCVPMRNCAFVKDDGFTSAFVIAHEVGHIFGLMHDGHGNNCYGREYTTSIMATMVQSAFNRYWWSGCSKTRMHEVIGSLTCLNNNPRHVIKEDLPDPVGLHWSLDEQCMFEFGSTSRHCKIFGTIDPCSQMWCTDGHAYQCRTKNVIPLDGTRCGPSRQWYCKKGACGYHGNEKPVNGNWGEWSQWSNCSAECGIGFKRRSRQCDSPKPRYGGKECDSDSEDLDTCKAKTCKLYEDSRAAQCSVMDIVPVRGSTHVWLPYQTDNVSDRCKLTCISQSTNDVVTFDTLVDNGTPCSYDDYNSICIDGKCQVVGCDGHRESQAKEDKCGVCEGDGSSCKTVSGVYSKKFEYSAAGQFYDTMLVLPKGSRNINIAESSVSPHFLSVQDTTYFKHLINAEGRQGTSKNFALEGAWFKYRNSGGYETLKAKGPIHRDVNVMIYPTNWQRPANVRYSYTVDKNDHTYEKNRYQWKFGNWSECSVTCGEGVQHIIYDCYDKEKGTKVDGDACGFLEDPNKDDVKCTRAECSSFLYIWRMLRNHSECSASCGKDGVHHLLYECEERATGNLVDHKYCSHIPEPKIFSPCNRVQCLKASYHWEVTSEWSECSASCGQSGTQYQLFYCVRETESVGEERVEERFCSDMVSPKEPRPCNRNPCSKYKWTVTNEWYECNQSCGDTGIQQKKVVCQKQELGKAAENVGIWYCRNQEKPLEKRECNVRECFSYQWRESGEWGECSQTCGRDAFREMVYHCKNVTYDDVETLVSDKYCDTSDKPGNQTKCTDIKPCDSFEWKDTSNWTDCTSRCGNDGTRTKIYSCVSTLSDEIVADSFCENAIMLLEEEPCNRFPCQTFAWKHVDEWYPECPKQCNNLPIAFQTKRTKCFQIFDNGRSEVTDEEYCSDLAKPTLMLKPCGPVTCSTYAWEESGWSPCSETCGNGGIKTQTVQCVETMDNGTRSIVNDNICENAPKLDLIQMPCRLPPCFRYKTTSDWSDCSVTCGDGVQTKEVVCVQRTLEAYEEEVALEMCETANITKPQRQCNPGPCGFMEWGAGPWSMCSMTCGPGRQKRIVYCGDPLKDTDPSMCPGLQPSEYQDCQMEPCRSNNRRTCRGDRAAFCKKANIRLCGHPAYSRVCCATCREVQQDQSRSRYRNYWNYRRRYLRRNG